MSCLLLTGSRRKYNYITTLTSVFHVVMDLFPCSQLLHIRDGSRIGLISANREGIFLCIGYIALYTGWVGADREMVVQTKVLLSQYRMKM